MIFFNYVKLSSALVPRIKNDCSLKKNGKINLRTSWADNKDLDLISVFPETRASAFDNTETASSLANSSSAASLNKAETSSVTLASDLGEANNFRTNSTKNYQHITNTF